MDKEPKTFEENKPAQDHAQEYDLLNQCRRCGIRAGRYQHKETKEFVGIFLYQDARGFKICNLCKEEGHLIKKQKMNKAERKRQKKMRRAILDLPKLPHITYDSKGNKIE